MPFLPFSPDDISPLVHLKFSENLHKWLSRNIKNRKEDLPLEFFRSEPHGLYIGHTIHDGHRAVRLYCVISHTYGAPWPRPTLWRHCDGMDFIPVPGLWEKYLEIGVCAFDTEHRWYSEKGRYSPLGKTRRTCDWCGALFKRKIVTTKKTRIDWIQQ